MLSPDERLIFRHLLDNEEFAALVTPHLKPEHFEEDAGEALYRLFLAYYRKVKTRPNIDMLHKAVDGYKKLNEKEKSACDAALVDLASVVTHTPQQIPQLILDTEALLRRRMEYRATHNLISKDATAADKIQANRDIAAALVFTLGTTSGRYNFLSLTELDAMPDTSWLIEEVIEEASFAAIFAPKEHFKTFAALGLACTIATPTMTKWYEHTVNVHGPVIYVIAEGQNSIKDRLHAWMDYNKITTLPELHIITHSILMTDAVATQQFIQEATRIQPKLVVFDTLSRCMAGADENSQKDMTKLVEAAGAMQATLGCTVLMVHHLNAAGTRERGSTVLGGGTTTEIMMVPDSTRNRHTSIVCGKQKNADHFASIPVKAELVTLKALNKYTGQPKVNMVLAPATPLDTMRGDSQRRSTIIRLKHDGLTGNQIAKQLGGKRSSVLSELKRMDRSGMFKPPVEYSKTEDEPVE